MWAGILPPSLSLSLSPSPSPLFLPQIRKSLNLTLTHPILSLSLEVFPPSTHSPLPPPLVAVVAPASSLIGLHLRVRRYQICLYFRRLKEGICICIYSVCVYVVCMYIYFVCAHVLCVYIWILHVYVLCVYICILHVCVYVYVLCVYVYVFI